MVEGGATNAVDSDQLIEAVVKYIGERKDLVDKLEGLLAGHNFKKEGEVFNESAIERVSELLKGNKDNKDLLSGAINIALEHLEQDKNNLKMLLEQANKVKGMEEKLEALGSRLLTQGVIGGAAFTTLTGALIGSLTIGGVAGALIVGGAALAGFVALVAVAAIAYAIYEHRGEIKEGVIKLGQAIKSILKDLIDGIPTVQERENNFKKLKNNLMEQHYKNANEEEKTTLGNKIKIVEMLQDKDQRSAIEELVKNKDIKDFSEKDLERLVGKGNSTHEGDMKALKELMDELLPKIMAIGENDIKKVELKIDEKVKEMKPDSKVDGPSSEPASKEEEVKR